MKNNIVHLIRLSMLLLLTVAGTAGVPTSFAAENGGAVQTNGVIQFYEETSSSSTTPSSSTSSSTVASTSSSTPITVPSSSEAPVTKPTGKYPSTGELVKTSLAVSGSALVVLVVLFFFWKRKKDAKEEGNG
ncbi:LPXTG cell wall anchor domain-containing protein [Candidatus Enterococcus clewellii]|uniref:Gram-positive cocci surface proteins LPxTG domain-containing protein n=1 Tax=Candidatus Enterococcus clewellii TaxID=1834193 RepID=A0A242JZ50_9ENTE|nr:LPXTG cell wall anchor domain-containing protein [Enterococcus sp. 9E7_DIV0242]OTP10514.1 hypothetical protein A5888_003812 [Enterococcus sp. 9E7_DIV0242]